MDCNVGLPKRIISLQNHRSVQLLCNRCQSRFPPFVAMIRHNVWFGAKRMWLHSYKICVKPTLKISQSSKDDQISRILWNCQFHYRSHERSPLHPSMNPMKPVGTLTSYFFEIHINVIFLPTSMTPSGLLTFSDSYPLLIFPYILQDRSTDRRGRVYSCFVFERSRVQISALRTPIHTDIFLGFPQPLKENSGILP